VDRPYAGALPGRGRGRRRIEGGLNLTVVAATGEKPSNTRLPSSCAHLPSGWRAAVELARLAVSW
jgi:hypothetical protein